MMIEITNTTSGKNIDGKSIYNCDADELVLSPEEKSSNDAGRKKGYMEIHWPDLLDQYKPFESYKELPKWSAFWIIDKGLNKQELVIGAEKMGLKTYYGFYTWEYLFNNCMVSKHLDGCRDICGLLKMDFMAERNKNKKI